MLARLGLVVYWLACAAALIIAGLGLFVVIAGTPNAGLAFVFGFAFVVWLSGRLVLFILAGH